MKIGYIAKNIPLPDFKENPIIINQAKLIMDSKDYDVEIYYPNELIPSLLLSFIPNHLAQRLKKSVLQKKTFKVSGISVKKINYIRFFLNSYLEWLAIEYCNFNLSEDIALNHAHFVFPDGLIAYNLYKKKNIPYILTIREGDFINYNKNHINKKLMLKVLNHASAIISLTYSLEEKIKSLDSKTPLYRIGNFINNDFFCPSNEIKKNNKPIISVVANFIPRKNIDWIIEYHNSNRAFELIICGNGSTNDTLREMANSEIKFTGYLSKEKIIEILDQSDIFVLPSEKETFGLVYIEAAARKNIVVGMKNTGVYEPNIEGFFFAKDKTNFFEILDTILELPKDKISMLKNAAYKHALNFREDIIRDKLLDLYKAYI
ncbi:glycosyltransferase [Providencia stuartii]|uniref:Putative glycosyltransferase n=3 Tax=Providencia stuartii TaxID=588 RepID=A0A346CLA8_PROST|nr:glycosyltransferase [Providencia stuartii]AXL96382.1 putative glycosyltransferase [Providencia stuartii]MDT2044572.1 glycosyltransferase [Providencia stuartii]MTC92149.1 glycosyltransferase [Providencia stuartii]HEM7146556.1 glycosyltransferase [Providencia stuartii]HEM8866446.1 glycosyltransferase [Providencia stuartii]